MITAATANASPASTPAHAVRAGTAARASAAGPAWAAKPQCADGAHLMCAEVDDYLSAFHWYVGHDEPSVLYYSNVPGSGNQMRYDLKLPSDPPPAPVPGRSWSFQLTPAIWFGMAMCDTQSYPEQVHTCAPDSNANITASLARHPGAAYMELQFYPPGWVKQFNGQSCDARDWCAALTIDSLSEDPVNGTALNTACQNQILGGIEYVNFAFITRDGIPQGPPNPLELNPDTSGAPTTSTTARRRSRATSRGSRRPTWAGSATPQPGPGARWYRRPTTAGPRRSTRSTRSPRAGAATSRLVTRPAGVARAPASGSSATGFPGSPPPTSAA